MSRYFGILFILVVIGFGGVNSHRYSKTAKKNETNRQEKLLSFFEVVRFTNDACEGRKNMTGTCYTAAECTAKGGTNSGACAQGYGICCTFTATCGATTAENGTYFVSVGRDIGHCKLKVCPSNDNICQIRLDFDQFSITGPSTTTVTAGVMLAGAIGVDDAGTVITMASKCLIDSFSVISPSGASPPTICGINSGEHMYVSSSVFCNDLVFTLGDTIGSSGVESRQWSIKITQYHCNHPNLAPDGCTQFFYGADIGTVKTFNFDGGQHLADQNQNICIRRERGNCRMCYTTEAESDFMTSGAEVTALADTDICCNYGDEGTETKYDCLVIPGALNPIKSSKFIPGSFDRFCGRTAGIVVTTDEKSAGNSQTVCTYRQPFSIRFLSDGFEGKDEIDLGVMAGFKLTYIQSAKGCTP